MYTTLVKVLSIIMNWTEFFTDIGVFGILAAAITYLIKHVLDKRIKNFGNELSHKSELFKAEVNLDSYKKERLYEKRLLIISDLYKRIVHLDLATKEMTAMMKPGGKDFQEKETERIDRTGNAYNEFLVHYRENDIYFNPKNCELLNQMIREYYDTLLEYSYEHRTGFKNPIAYREIVKKVDKEIPKVLETCKSDFRGALKV